MKKQAFLLLFITLSIPLLANNIFRPSGKTTTPEAHLNFMTQHRSEAVRRAAIWKVSALAIQVIASVQSGAGAKPGFNFGNVVANKAIIRFDKFSEAGTDGLLLCAKPSRGMEAIALGLAILKNNNPAWGETGTNAIATDEDYLQLVFGKGGDLHSMATEAEKAYAVYQKSNINLTTKPTDVLTNTPAPIDAPEKVVSATIMITPDQAEEAITTTEISAEINHSEKKEISIAPEDIPEPADSEIPNSIILFEEIEDMGRTLEIAEAMETIDTMETKVEMANAIETAEMADPTDVKVEPSENASAATVIPTIGIPITTIDSILVPEEKIPEAEPVIVELGPEEQEAAIQAAYLRASLEAEKELYRSQLAEEEKARAEEEALRKELEAYTAATKHSRIIRLGVKAGVTANRLQVSNDQLEVATSEKYQFGYCAGVLVGVPFANHLLFESGLLYAAKGSSRDFEYNNSTVSQQFNYIQLPLQLKHIAQNGKLHFFFQGGAYLGMALNGKRKITQRPVGAAAESSSEDLSFGDAPEDTYKRLDYGLTSGFGIQIRAWDLGLTYDLGLANISKNRKNGLSMKNRGVGLFLAYGF
jgi:Outer membrane protein beta-barrel domain